MGFLLTTVECAWDLGTSIIKKERRATAVFANPILKDGQRINIFKIAYFFTHVKHENDIGVVMVGRLQRMSKKYRELIVQKTRLKRLSKTFLTLSWHHCPLY